MDEILRPAQSDGGSTIAEQILTGEQVQSFGSKLSKAAHAVQAGAIVLGKRIGLLFHKADCAMAGHKVISPLPFLAVAAVAAVAFVVSSVYIPSYVVSVDGVTLGTVTDPAVFEEVVDRVEARAANILGHEYTLDQDVEYTFALSKEDDISSPAGFEPYLFNHVGDVMKSYVLTVNGQFIGACDNCSDLECMLDELSSAYVNENTTSVSFVDDVNISYEYIASDVEQDLSAMSAILTSTNEGETVYTVVSGDTYSGIAYANDMSVDELMTLNPQASLKSLFVGDELTVAKTVPFLSVRTTESVEYYEEIPCPVEEVSDSNMYQGNTKVLQYGSNGQALVTADVVYVNGYEEAREITSTTTVTEPTARVIAVGTKPRPATLPTGSFSWPLSGHISSYYGWRYIFGSSSFHGGIDIVAAHGTPIAAADGGTVIWSGYKGSYGNLVIIDHGEGVHSYYAHCSSLMVSAGSKVYKGQYVGLVGSTGRSTGPHLHFEVRINNSTVNPLSYLP